VIVLESREERQQLQKDNSILIGKYQGATEDSTLLELMYFLAGIGGTTGLANPTELAQSNVKDVRPYVSQIKGDVSETIKATRLAEKKKTARKSWF
jgi:hypothetical protein